MVYSFSPLRRLIERRILWEAFGWTAAALIMELGLGWWYAGSVSLLADAGHVAHHLAAIFVGLAAIRASGRAATMDRQRAIERGATIVVGLLLILAAPALLWQAWQQLREPGEIREAWMVATAFGGLASNYRVLVILRRCTGLLILGIAQHTLWDLFSSALVCACSLMVAQSRITRVDAIGGLIVGVGVIVSGLGIVISSVRAHR